MIGGSLCTGGGGLDLGLSRVLDIEWAWHCEPDASCNTVLELRWPGVPNLGDLFGVEWETVERVDLLAAGFPCPDYSLAGRRKGIEGDHGQVWYGVASAIRALRPRYVVLENVPGIRTAAGVRVDAGESALGVVCADMAEIGYRWAYDCLRAADVGAPHGRDRWFCVAALDAAADAERGGVDADRRVRGRGAGEPRRSAQAAVPAGAEVARAEDALADRAGAPADADGDVSGRVGGGFPRAEGPRGGRGGASESRGREAAADAERERLDGRGGGDEGGAAGVGPDRRAVAAGSAEPPPDAEGVARPPAGPLGRRGLPAPGDDGASGRDRGRGQAAADADGGGRDEGAERPERGLAGLEARERGEAAADPDDAGRGEHGGAVAARAQLGAAERGRDEAAADADGRGREVVGEPESGGVEGARGGQPDGRGPVRGLEDAAAAAADPDGGGREGERGSGEQGGRPPGDAPRHGAEAAADAGREPGEPGDGRRAAGGADARGGTQERDGDRLARPAEPGETLETAADPGGRGRGRGPDFEGEGPAGRGGPRGDGEAPADAAGGRRGRGPSDARPGDARDGEAPVGDEGGRPVGDGAGSGDAAAADAGDGEPEEQEGDDELDGERAPERRGEQQPAGARADSGAPGGGLAAGPAAVRGAAAGDEGDRGLAPTVEWGVYEPAVRRWERIIGRAAPAPTDDRGRLAPEFVEWMLGYPDGHVSACPITRTAMLRILGNSVQVQCAEEVALWLSDLVESGLLLAA